MDLREEQEVVEKKSKLPIFIGVMLVILVIITISIICAIIYLSGLGIKISINGQRNYKMEEMIYIDKTENETKLYMPIIKIAPIFGYEGFWGDYIDKSEDRTKCYVKNENEVAMFTLNSNILVKWGENSQDEEYIILDEPVFEKNGELYMSINGGQDAFDMMFDIDNNFQNIHIFTKDYLIEYYTTALQIENYSEDYIDKKAIFQNMIIVKNGNGFGVIEASTGKNILENKYEDIRYLPESMDFIVKSNGKYGIVTKDATVKVKTIYDEIKAMDKGNGLFLVKYNNLYGVINSKGQIILEPEYRQIGLDVTNYSQNGIKNSYVLLNKFIPIKNEQNLWGIFNLKGEKITEFKYTGIGCSNSLVNNSYPVLVIPSNDIIVVQTNQHYNLLTKEGRELAPDNRLNSVYLKVNTSTEENQYFMVIDNNEKVVNIEEWLTSAQQ